MMPPAHDTSVGNGGFEAIGAGILQELKVSCGLLPHHTVLDVGCGIGRVAIPLTQYLAAGGRYEGFDPVLKSVRRCQRWITPSYPNFSFQHADISNRRYNPGGQIHDFEFRFPYPDATFDIAFATSVFTHMLPAGVAHYLAETTRVLKAGGVFLATFYLLNPASLAALEAGLSSINFGVRYEHHRVFRRYRPEACVAYDEPYILGLYSMQGLAVSEVGHGTWSGRAPTSYGGSQDVIIAVRS